MRAVDAVRCQRIRDARIYDEDRRAEDIFQLTSGNANYSLQILVHIAAPLSGQVAHPFDDVGVRHLC